MQPLFVVTLQPFRADRTTFEELADLFLHDFQVNGRKTLNRSRQLVDRLKESFAKFRAHDITSSHLARYIARRQEEEAAPATINRELGALKRMFTLALRQTPPLVQPGSVPHVPKLKEDNVRKGFFTADEYRLLRGVLPDYVKIPFVLAYWTGMRGGEILSLKWEQVDWERGYLRLEPGTTKNNRGRHIPLVREVLIGLDQWWRFSRQRYPQCEWICHYHGVRLQIILRKQWKKACLQVGLAGKLFHDLRRTGVRNLVRAGVPERVAMEISGHRTRSVFDRYNIVSEDDFLQAREKLDRLSTISSTVAHPDMPEPLVSG